MNTNWYTKSLKYSLWKFCKKTVNKIFFYELCKLQQRIWDNIFKKCAVTASIIHKKHNYLQFFYNISKESISEILYINLCSFWMKTPREINVFVYCQWEYWDLGGIILLKHTFRVRYEKISIKQARINIRLRFFTHKCRN